MITTVKQYLGDKKRDIWSVAPDTLVHEALELLAEKDVGALLVMENNKLVGIFSERDYARKGIIKGRHSKSATVKEMMTVNVLYTTPDSTIQDCMGLMTAKHVRHLPVMEGDEVVGIITIGDVVNAIISDQKFMIEQMERYVTRGA